MDITIRMRSTHVLKHADDSHEGIVEVVCDPARVAQTQMSLAAHGKDTGGSGRVRGTGMAHRTLLGSMQGMWQRHGR